MPRRNPLLVTDEIYHVFNRGVEKRDLFVTTRDYKHFLETLDHYYRIPNSKLSRKGKQILHKLPNKQLVEILAYCLMPNHFHLLLKQKEDDGISNFIRLAGNSFTRYFNTKNERIGPLFQGPFKAVPIENDEQLLHVSRYIHLNPFVASLVTHLKDYPWSSYAAYIDLEMKDRQNLAVLNKKFIMSYFPSGKDYENFVLDQADYARRLEEIKHHQLD